MSHEGHTPDEWVDVCIRTDVDAGDLLSMLDDPAVQGAWEDAGTVHLYWPATHWNRDRLVGVRGLLARLDLAGDAARRVSVNRVPHQDWNRQWAQSVTPLTIGRLVIRPTWAPVALNPNEVELVLDPKQAFGTGHHATTRMLLEWLQVLIRERERVLDVGTGSGILAMAAVKLGAQSAIGVENDPVALDCAREAVINNHVSDRVVLVGTLGDVNVEDARRVDLVLANLDRRTLLHLAEELAGYGVAGAALLVSGILLDQEADIVERFGTLGLACRRRCEQEGWLALELIAPDPCEGSV